MLNSKINTFIPSVLKDCLLWPREFYLIFSIILALDNLILSKMSQTQDTSGMKLWQCEECGYARERKSDVFKHVERRHIDVQVSCQYCDAVFTNRLSLKEHLKFRHGVS